jgi:hypothetical protein
VVARWARATTQGAAVQRAAAGNSVVSEDDSSLDLAYQLVGETEEESGRGGRMRANGRARPIGNHPSMDTGFGEDVDPDGLSGSAIDSAMDRYEIFHAKKPLRVAELAHDIPTSWTCVGDGLAVMYRTDKWKADGTDEDYKHLHDKRDDEPYQVGKGVRFYEPAAEVRRSTVRGKRRTSRTKGKRLPVRIPKALTLLGYCLGAFVRRDDDGETYEVNPRGCYLFCSPSGDLLLLYSPEEQADGSSGFLAAMAGWDLRVLKDGIDG